MMALQMPKSLRILLQHHVHVVGTGDVVRVACRDGKILGALSVGV